MFNIICKIFISETTIDIFCKYLFTFPWMHLFCNLEFFIAD